MKMTLNESLLLTTVLFSSLAIAQSVPVAGSGARPADNRSTDQNKINEASPAVPSSVTDDAGKADGGTEASSNNGSTGAGRIGSKPAASNQPQINGDCGPDSKGRMNHSKHCAEKSDARTSHRKGQKSTSVNRGNQDSTAPKSGTNADQTTNR